MLDAHAWFTDPGLTGSSYGAIISDFNEFDANPELYRDVSTLTTANDFNQVLKRMAYGEFEADVITAYEKGDY